MDTCSIDWKAIGSFVSAGATLIGAGVAWKISEKWRDQKRSDVVSEIAKVIYKQRKEYKDKLTQFSYLLNLAFIDQLKNESDLYSSIDAYRSIHLEFKTNVEIIYKYYSNKLLEKSTNKLLEKYNVLDDLINMYILGKNKVIDVNKSKKICENIINTVQEINKIIDSKELEKELIDYILHKSIKIA